MRVSILYGGCVIEIYVFLNSGLNVIMCLNSLVEELGAECILAEFILFIVISS